MRNLFPDSLLDRAVRAPQRFDRPLHETLLGPWRHEALPGALAVPRQVVRPVEVCATSDAYLVRCELPGYDPAEVHVELTGDVLTIRGEAGREAGSDGATGAHGFARRHESFSRSLRLGQEIDREQVGAELKNGVLMVTLPRRAASQPRRIEVRSSSSPSGVARLEHQPAAAAPAPPAEGGRAGQGASTGA